MHQRNSRAPFITSKLHQNCKKSRSQLKRFRSHLITLFNFPEFSREQRNQPMSHQLLSCSSLASVCGPKSKEMIKTKLQKLEAL